MVVVHCTRPLLRRFGARPAVPLSTSDTRLGAWTATLVIARPSQLLLLVSHRALLPVVVAAAPAATWSARFRDALGGVLDRLGVDARRIAAELAAMDDVHLAPVSDQRVIGSVNAFRRSLLHEMRGARSLVEVALSLAQMPCGPIGNEAPERVAPALFRD